MKLSLIVPVHVVCPGTIATQPADSASDLVRGRLWKLNELNGFKPHVTEKVKNVNLLSLSLL